MTKALAIGGISIGGLIVLLAQAAEMAHSAVGDEIGAIAPWAQLTALGVITALLVWMVTRYVPQQAMAERESRQRLDGLFAATLKELAERYERRSEIRDASFKEIATAVTKLQVHCAEQLANCRIRQPQPKQGE